jgi:methionine aminopeptidase
MLSCFIYQMAREVLDHAATQIRPGITTDEIDEIVHQAIIERNAYPSPLNYRNFPKSVCTCVLTFSINFLKSDTNVFLYVGFYSIGLMEL